VPHGRVAPCGLECRHGCRNVVLRMGDPLSVRVECTRDWPDGAGGGVRHAGMLGGDSGSSGQVSGLCL
jgi:hypothetical protein